MLKTLLATSLLALAFSGLTYAVDTPVENYVLSVTDKQHKIRGDLLLEVGQTPYSYGGTMKLDHQITSCDSYINSDFPEPVQVYDSKNAGTGLKVYTISQIRETFHIVVAISYYEDFQTENSIKMNDDCVFANSVSSTIDVNWAGDISVGHPVTIKLPNNNELYMQVTQGFPPDEDWY